MVDNDGHDGLSNDHLFTIDCCQLSTGDSPAWQPLFLLSCQNVLAASLSLCVLLNDWYHALHQLHQPLGLVLGCFSGGKHSTCVHRKKHAAGLMPRVALGNR